MAATVAPSQSIISGGGGLHPLQAQGLHAAQRQHQQQQQQLQPPGQNQQPAEDVEPFDVKNAHLTLNDFVRVRTLGTGKNCLPNQWL